MKRIKLEKKLKKLGWWFLRHGGNHDVWTDGRFCLSIPRHTEVNEWSARSIIKAASNPKSDGF
jgi:mRNA interferase HicA